MWFQRCCACGQIFSATDVFVPWHCPHCLEMFFMKPLSVEDSFTQEDLRELWRAFADIPVGDEDELLEEFLSFPCGTNRFDVWHWFDERYIGGVSTLIWDAVYRKPAEELANG